MTHDNPSTPPPPAPDEMPLAASGFLTFPGGRLRGERRDPLGVTGPRRVDEFVPPRGRMPAGGRIEHVGSCACLVPDAPTGQRFLLLDGEPRTVGRSHDNDLVINETSISRRHFGISVVEDTLPDGARDRRWVVEDLGSTNGTWLGGERLERGAPRPLRDGAVVGAGDEKLTFYLAEGEHRQVVRRFLEDADVLLFSPDTIRYEVDRLARRHLRATLALVGIDDYAWIGERVDEFRRQRLLQHVGAELLSVLRELGGRLLGALRPGTFAFFLDDVTLRDGADSLQRVHGSLRTSLQRAEAQLRDMGITGGRLGVSAALVPVEPEVPPAQTIERGLAKLLQATNAGGNRVSASAVRPLWDGRRKERWLGRLASMRSVAFATPGLGSGGTMGSDLVLRWVASNIDLLPAGTEVAVCTSSLPASWLIAASCSLPELQMALGKTAEVKVVAAESGPTAEYWVADLEGRFAGAAARGRAPLWVFAQLDADYRSSHEGERLLKAVRAFEGVTRFLGSLAIAGFAHARHQSPGDERVSLGRAGHLAALASLPHGVFPSSRAWLKVAGELSSFLPPGRFPSAGRQLLGDARWMDRCTKAAALRAAQVHGPATGAREATTELWACVKQAVSVLVEDQLRIYRVDFAEPRRGRRGAWRVRRRLLSAAGALGEVEEKDVAGSAISGGLWAVEADEWIPLSPLLEVEQCPDCNRFDLFAARSLPKLEQAFDLAGLVDLHPRRGRVSEDEPELWQLLWDLASPPQAPTPRSPEDREITGRWDIARIRALEESLQSQPPASERATLPNVTTTQPLDLPAGDDDPEE